MKEKNKKQSEDFPLSLFKWAMDKRELKNQIENYNTLGFFKSSRKLATALIIFIAITTLILVITNWAFASWIDVISALVLAFFVYKGKRWAIIITMAYWTLSTVFKVVYASSIENLGSVLMPIIFWALFMGVFWQAYQVERERKRLKN